MLRAESPSLRSRLLRRPVISDWRGSATMLASLLILLPGYRAVIRGDNWLTVSALFVVLIIVTCAVIRALGVPLAWVGGIIVWLVALVCVFAHGSLLGVLPTPSTIGHLHRLWVEAQGVMGLEQPPVAASRPIIYVMAASFGGLAVILDVIVFELRKPLLAGALLAAIYVFPSAASGDEPNIWIFLATAALWLYLMRKGPGQRRPTPPRSLSRTGPTVAIALAALAVSLALPPVLPHVTNIAVSWGNPSPGAFDRGINPILQLGQNLRRNSTVTALTYTTTAEQAPYLKVANLLDFNGKVWKPSESWHIGRTEGSAELDPNVARKVVTTKIAIQHLKSPRLPVPYPALEFSGLKGEWRFEQQGLTLTSNSSDSSDQTYTIKSLQVEPTSAQMRSSVTTIDPSLRRYLELPSRMPSDIAKTADKVTAGATNDYDKAIALQSYFRDGDFIYSETAPVSEGYDGTGVDVIAQFLKAKQGYCVHFSSAMAVMARTLGIPSRIAVGYAPGTESGTDRDGNIVYEDTSDDLHAWPELYFGGIGWVSFEPTPGVGAATSFQDTSSPTDVAPDSGAPPLQKSDPTRSTDRSLVKDAPAVTEEGSSNRTPIIAVCALIVLLMILPGALGRAQHAWRLRTSRRSPSRLWEELGSIARDHGISVTRSETPRTFAEHVRSWPGMDAEALGRLLSSVERERFGPPGPPDDSWTDFRVVVGCIRSGATRTQRLRAALLPRSLFGQSSYGPRPEPA